MVSTPVSLKSLHYLLQHMEANKRFEVCQRCPALQEIEKSVPLKIDFLVLKESYVIVNDVTYELGIIRECKVGETPWHVAATNARGGDPYEVDRYGIRDKSDEFMVTPGDVVINQRENQFLLNDDLYIGELEEAIQICEGQLADLRGRRRNRENLERINLFEKAIEDKRARILEYQFRRENTPSKYEFFLQLTKTLTVDEQDQVTIERYAHNKKYSEAMKQLTTVLFGGRCSPIFVKKFKFLHSQGVVRLPVGFKLHIERLVFAVLNTSVEVLAPILQESSFPLKKLEIDVWSVNDDATIPIVETAEILRINDLFGNDPQTILSMTNPVIHIPMWTLSEETILKTIEDLVANRIASNLPIGNVHVFDFDDGPRFESEVEDLLKSFNGLPFDDETVIIPLSDSTQLIVSYGPFPVFAPRSKWAVRLFTELIED